MTKKQLESLLKYSSPKEIYIITWNSILKLLVCPFEVVVINDVGELYKGEIVMVDEIKITTDIKTVYIIKSKAYYYSHFEILG